MYLSQSSRSYLSDLTDYHKVLAQRNAFLKNDFGGADNPYDDLLVQYGVSIMDRRYQFISEIALQAEKFYGEISSGGLLKVGYRASFACDESDWHNKERLTEKFHQRLHQVKEREKALQSSLAGPHRDDIVFEINGLPARAYGSQGELRTTAIVLKLAVYNYLRQMKHREPILLLDEVFAELDSRRQAKLIEALGEFGQLFITTAAEVPPLLEKQATKFKIYKGQVEM